MLLRAPLLAVGAVTLLAVIACTSTRPVGGVGSLRAATSAIEVTNDRFDYVVVYVIDRGTRIELGVVPAMSSRTFTPSPAQVSTGAAVSLGAGHRGAAMNQVTQPLHLLPGRIASWTIPDGNRVEQPIVR